MNTKTIHIQIHNLDKNLAIQSELVHTSDYLNFLKKKTDISYDSFVKLDDDTMACKESLDVALDALRIHTQAIEAVYDKKVPSFVMSRPPGHHAGLDYSMGFCIFNNIAYTAKYAQEKLGTKKIFIIDWDAHQFNGTEDIFLKDSYVYTVSFHQYLNWPEQFGWSDMRGQGNGHGYNLNLPMPINAGDWQFASYVNQFVLPELIKFQPDLILVSAGFDSHICERENSMDSAGHLSLTENGYSFMTNTFVNLANQFCDGKILFTLEGGYNLPSLKTGVQSVWDTILEDKIKYYNQVSSGQSMDGKLWSDYQISISSNL